MGLVARLLGQEPWDDHEEQRISRLQATTREQTRRELVSMAVRDTLKKHGLPPGCITADALPGVTPTRHRGVHIQLVFRDRQASLLAYVVALESAVKSRLQRLDPLAPAWVTGISWRFEPADRTVWPKLPAPAKPEDRAQPAVALEALLEAGDEAFIPTHGGDAAAATAFSPTLPMRA
jgi:hypothetical protein